MDRIDLNADLGEECGDDYAMLDLVSSASIAAGGHAGGGSVLAETVQQAVERGVWIGAHVSYPDRDSFGRESWRGRDLSGLAGVLADQMAEVAQAAAASGDLVRHVKAHGALYNDAAQDPSVAEVLAEALDRLLGFQHPCVASDLGVLAPPQSAMAAACSAVTGVRVVAEVFTDRAYRPDGTLVPRTQPGAVLTDASAIASRAVGMVRAGRVTADDGTDIEVRPQTLCIHGDTPDAVRHARALVRALTKAGIAVRPWGA